MSKTVGVALGGGGAKGLAHLCVLQALDRMGITVSAISGTSIGAIIGALYASGLNGRESRAAIDEMLARPRTLAEAMDSGRLLGWVNLLGLDIGRGQVLQAEGFVEELGKFLRVDSFESLKIPLQVVAADFWNRTQVVLDSGPLIPAIAASFCLPGVFKPLLVDGCVLVDGGSVNPVPFDLLRQQCDIVIAVDVLGQRASGEDLIPSTFEALFNSFQIAERTIADQKLLTAAPDIYLRAPIEGVKVLEFHKADMVYAQMEPAVAALEKELEVLLGHSTLPNNNNGLSP